jgi:TolA-binding protein
MRRRRSALAAALFLAAAPLVGALLPVLVRPAHAQAESREGIFLQNQILQLRQELETLRRSGGSALAAPIPRGGGGAGPSGELLSQLLDRVGGLEEEVRRMRGRLDEAEFRNRQLSQAVEKLQGDLDFRLQQLEGGGGGRRRQQRSDADGSGGGPAAGGLAAGPPAAPLATPDSPPPPPPRPAAPAVAPRTPERLIADGQAALSRRDYGAAEAAVRDVLATRNAQRAADAQLLLADALAGKRDHAGAALAYNDAYVRGRTSPRAPDALLGLANSFANLGHKREACDTLDDLRGHYPNLRSTQAERAADTRRRAGCSSSTNR